ncbi:glycosyltransferase family 2 protein [Fructilactobacillus sp. Tb1]|uniref:glycosyltransferase family 2 protein n=1 Tax=Fructilactobacillus sp. Tb1 TaxID=3422304 RepID=UPI003D2A790F
MNQTVKVAVVMVTFNRLDYLKVALEKLLNQEFKPAKIFVINNCSTDGTKEYLSTLDDDSLEVINLDKNLGGAGGFSKGLELAYNAGNFDYYWVMDDDTYVNPDTLKEFVEALNKFEDVDKVGILASNVRWNETDQPSIMNTPITCPEDWNYKATEGLIKIASSSFVSMLISNKALVECGLPISEFFIWGDDVEFSRRVMQKFSGYFVSNSIVNHETKANSGVDMLEEKNPNKIGRYFYAIRNDSYIAREFSKREKYRNSVKFWYLFFKLIFGKSPYSMKKLKVLIKGYWSGKFFNPKIKYLEPKNEEK